MPTRLPLLAALLVVAGCDTQAPPPAEAAPPIVGTWEMTGSAYRTLATAAVDVSYISPYHPAEGTLAVDGLETAALAYVINTPLPGPGCDAGCRPRVELWSRPLTGRQLPDRAELVLDSVTSAALEVWTDDQGRGYRSSGVPAYEVTPTTLTVPSTPLFYGGTTVGELAGSLELPVRSLAAGVEGEVRPFLPDVFAAEGITILWTFAADGTFELAFDDAVTGEVRTNTGTWALDGDRLAVTSDVDGPVSTTTYEVRLAGSTLELVAGAAVGPVGRGDIEQDLRIDGGALAAARYENRTMLVRTAPR